MEPDGTLIMGNSSSLSQNKFQGETSVGKLGHDDALVEKVYDFSFAIFQTITRAEKIFDSMIEFGPMRAFRGFLSDKISLFYKKVASLDIFYTNQRSRYARKRRTHKKFSRTRCNRVAAR